MTKDRLAHLREEWRPVPGFEDRYDVSNTGKVRSWAKSGGHSFRRAEEPRAVAIKVDAGGYHGVFLYRRKKAHHRFISRLVLEEFVSPPPKGLEAAHINGVPGDNRLSNLQWCSRAENESHKREHGTVLRGSRHHQAVLNEANVLEIRAMHEAGATTKELAQRFQVHANTIRSVVTRKKWRHL
jgi:hypothetical protein